ncbi:MAG: hypothetical protein QNJ55_29700 [Xenococcus sp. MO_188.B8]|nr:hypothetical protein [Xenococcus sp. MO_188.B8]
MHKSKSRSLVRKCLLVMMIGFCFFLSSLIYTPKASSAYTNIDSACQGLDIDNIAEILASEELSAEFAQNQSDCYAWDLFIALNWPAQQEKPWLPDTNKEIGDPEAVVWESWKATSEVYLPKGAQPQPWETQKQVPLEVLQKAKELGLPLDEPFQNIGLIQQVSGLVFKSNEDNQGNLIRYELAMNASTFDYILGENPYQTGLYNINGQKKVAQSCQESQILAGDCIQFNWNAKEIKTSWLWLDKTNPNYETINDTYITSNAYYQEIKKNGQPVIDGQGNPVYQVGRAALTGMHITSKALPKWAWTTFENVNNAKYTTSTIELGIPEDAQAVNRQIRPLLQEKGTKYANYELVGTQIDFNKPTLLANSQIESHFQHASSCITCHAFASITTQDTGPFRLSFVDTRGGNLSYYVGDLPQETLDQIEQKEFIPMDFVWSLRLAKRQR